MSVHGTNFSVKKGRREEGKTRKKTKSPLKGIKKRLEN